MEDRDITDQSIKNEKENKSADDKFEFKESSQDAVKLLHSKIPVFYVDSFYEHSTIQAAVLCYWDNIYGPKVKNLWMVGKRPESQVDKDESENELDKTKDKKSEKNENSIVLDWEGLNVVARQSLCSEIMKNPSQPHLDSKLVHCPNKKLAMIGIGFGAMSQMDVSIHSLVIVAVYNKVDVFLRFKDVLDAWLLRCAMQLRVTLATNAQNGYSIVREGVKEMIRLIDHSPSVLDLPAPRTTWGRENGEISLDLMHEAAVGHLSQGHHSIIIGSNAAIVNEMVYRLSQLSLPQYHHRHHPLTNPHQPFSPDLHIQGLYKNEETLAMIGELCGFCDKPSCLIDMDTKEVYIQGDLEQYGRVHRAFLTNNLLQLWNECTTAPPSVNEIFKPIKVTDSLLLESFKNMYSLPDHLMNPLSHHLMKMLHRKVLVLMHCLAAKLNKLKPTSKAAKAEVDSYEGLVRGVRAEMGLERAWDWRVVLSCAEVIHPGLIRSLASFPYKNASV